jgi:phage-related protein
MFELIFYKDEKDQSPVYEYLSALSKKQQDKVIAYMDRLAQFGFGLRRPIADCLGGGLGLYELRPDRHRILYCFQRRTQVLLLHAFLKRTDDIPQSEIEIALKRRADYLKRKVLL